jgi:hypothetical protein
VCRAKNQILRVARASCLGNQWQSLDRTERSVSYEITLRRFINALLSGKYPKDTAEYVQIINDEGAVVPILTEVEQIVIDAIVGLYEATADKDGFSQISISLNEVTLYPALERSQFNSSLSNEG